MKIRLPAFSTLLIAALLAGTCSAQAEDVEQASQDLTAVERINTFGIRLLQAALDLPDGDNILLSPLNLAQAAFMLDSGTSEGSDEDSGAAIGALFGLEGADGLTSLALQTAELSQNLQRGGAAGPLRLAASIWIDPELEPWPDHQAILEDIFAATTEQVDFAEPGTLDRINAAIADQTDDLISPMLNELDERTRLLLASALHFKADWASPFDPAQTAEGPFTTAKGDVIEAEFMTIESVFEKWRALDSEFVAIPFSSAPDQAAFELVIGLPGAAVDVASWTDEEWQAILDHAPADRIPSPTILQLPRLSVMTGGDMTSVFDAAGFGQLFSTPFNTISKQPIVVDSLVHRAILEWDETGAEAAAATVVNMVRTTATAPGLLRVDRPFLVLLRERESGAILLAGSIRTP